MSIFLHKKIEKGDILEELKSFFRNLFEKGIVESLLAPQEIASKKFVVPALIKNIEELKDTNPLAPVVLTNGATLVGRLTVDNPQEKIGVVLRNCEIRALIELSKLKQAKLDNLVIISLDCLGTYEPEDYAKLIGTNKDQKTLSLEHISPAQDGWAGRQKDFDIRKVCQICEYPLAEKAHINICLFGQNSQAELVLSVSEDIAQKLGWDKSTKAEESREKIKSEVIKKKMQARDELFKNFGAKIDSLAGLLAEFWSCRRCYNCRRECPICYCKECIFDSTTFEHKSEQYFQWAKRKGLIKMPTDTLLYHLTRLNHMVASCVGCGECSSACPNNLPVMELFRTIGAKVQKLFDYVPGRDPEEEMPMATFREDEFVEVGS